MQPWHKWWLDPHCRYCDLLSHPPLEPRLCPIAPVTMGCCSRESQPAAGRNTVPTAFLAFRLLCPPLLFCHSVGTISTPSTAPEILCRARKCKDVLSGLSDASTTAGEMGLAWKQKPLWLALQICAWHYIFSIQMPGESQVTFINLGFASASWLNT